MKSFYFVLFNFVTACFAKPFIGAKLNVTCVPTQVVLNESFSIQVQYKTDIPREVDIHFDVIDGRTNEWVTGSVVESNFQVGKVSLNVTVPATVDIEKVVWKVFVAPRGQVYPDIFDEKYPTIIFGDTVINPCSELPLKGKNLTATPVVDYVLIETKNLTSGTNTVLLRAKLFSRNQAELTYNIMSENNTLLASGEIVNVTSNSTNDVYNMTVDIPTSLPDKYYSIAMLSPNGEWKNRYAEDRYYYTNGNLRGTKL
jgi:hypothetical protein